MNPSKTGYVLLSAAVLLNSITLCILVYSKLLGL